MRPETHLGPVTLYHRFFFLADRGGIRFAAFLDRGERLTFNTRRIESRRLQRESVCGGSRTRGLAIDPSRVNRVDHPWRDVHLLPSLSLSLPLLHSFSRTLDIATWIDLNSVEAPLMGQRVLISIGKFARSWNFFRSSKWMFFRDRSMILAILHVGVCTSITAISEPIWPRADTL